MKKRIELGVFPFHKKKSCDKIGTILKSLSHVFYLALLLVWYFSKHFLQMNSSHFEQYEDVLFLDWVLSALCTYTHTAQHLQIRCLLN